MTSNYASHVVKALEAAIKKGCYYINGLDCKLCYNPKTYVFARSVKQRLGEFEGQSLLDDLIEQTVCEKHYTRIVRPHNPNQEFYCEFKNWDVDYSDIPELNGKGVYVKVYYTRKIPVVIIHKDERPLD